MLTVDINSVMKVRTKDWQGKQVKPDRIQMALIPDGPWTKAPEVGTDIDCEIVTGTFVMVIDMRELEPSPQDRILVQVEPKEKK